MIDAHSGSAHLNSQGVNLGVEDRGRKRQAIFVTQQFRNL